MARTRDMFDTDNPVEITEKFESYKAALSQAIDNPVLVQPGTTAGTIRKVGPAPESSASQMQKSIASGELEKSGVPAELVESLRASLAQAEMAKTSPSTGMQIGNPTNLFAYDLEQGAKILAPRVTPIRNRTARRKGVGTAHEFRRITGFTGTNTGGLGLISPGITETTTNQFGAGNLAYMRGPKIQYAGDSVSVPYLAFSMSTDVTWMSQFASVGFDDERQITQNALLWSSMLAEENLMLGARGTKTGFGGALAAPTATAAPRTATLPEVGATATVVTLYVAVTAVGHWGESAPTVITIGSSAVVSGAVVDVSITDVPGALGYRVYTGTSNTVTTGAYAGLFAAAVSGPVTAPGVIGVQAGTKAGKLTINFTGAGTAGVPNSGANPVVADGSASVNHYDGLLSYCTGSQAGYVNRLNNSFAGADGTNVGNTFGVAFSAMYDANQADPDEILANGNDRKQVSDQLKTQGSSAYRISLVSDEMSGATIGSVVNAIYNPVTGKAVQLTVHPYLKQGTMPIISWTLPLPDSNISDVFAAYNVQEYLGVNWPSQQFLYESSSFWQGTYVCYAPAWCGAIQGIWKA